MGQFSWITQDTNEAIFISTDELKENYGFNAAKSMSTAYLHDNKGNVWEEKHYEGYGVFGGKDFYVLLAEMNLQNPEILSLEELREVGIEIAFEKPHISPNITRHKEWTWINEKPEHDPNRGCEN